MRLHTALSTSICLHALIILGPAWFATRPPATPQARIEARLLPPEELATTADSLSTTAMPSDATMALPPKPGTLRGASLRRAEAALTRHLFYPPEAVARGIEGEVILLPTMTHSCRPPPVR